MKAPLLGLYLLFAATQAAFGYEYTLQFTAPSGARGLTVAGYGFNNGNVVGDCTYYTVTSTGGRGSRTVTTYHYNNCSWDLHGNLLSVTPVSQEMTAPAVLSTNGTEIIYAWSGSTSTGKDTRGFGFVSTPSAHYSWQTANGTIAVIPDSPYSITATLISDGDFPLGINSASVSAVRFGTVTSTAGTASISADGCPSSLAVGYTCSVTVKYNPTTISCTSSSYGYAYTGIDLQLVTNAGAHPDFTERFTVTGVPVCNP